MQSRGRRLAYSSQPGFVGNASLQPLLTEFAGALWVTNSLKKINDGITASLKTVDAVSYRYSTCVRKLNALAAEGKPVATPTIEQL